MSKAEKRLWDIQNAPHDVRPEDLKAAMKGCGFRFKESNSESGGLFYHPEHPEAVASVAWPHGGGEKKVKRVYVKNCLRAIELLEELSEDESDE